MYRLFRQGGAFRLSRRKKEFIEDDGKNNENKNKEDDPHSKALQTVDSTPSSPTRTESTESKSQASPTTHADDNNLEPVVEIQHVSKTVEELLVLPEPKPLRRSISCDSYSTWTSAADSYLDNAGNGGMSVFTWGDDVVPLVTTSVNSSSPRIQKARRLPEPSDYDLALNMLQDEIPLPSADKEEDSEVLLAKRLFSTLGVPRPPAPQQKEQQRLLRSTVETQPPPPPPPPKLLQSTSRRRSMMRRSSSGGLDPYLTAPARFTRFEI